MTSTPLLVLVYIVLVMTSTLCYCVTISLSNHFALISHLPFLLFCISLAGWRASRSNTLSPLLPSAPANTPVAGMSGEDKNNDSTSEEGKVAGGKRVVEFRALGYKYEQIK